MQPYLKQLFVILPLSLQTIKPPIYMWLGEDSKANVVLKYLAKKKMLFWSELLKLKMVSGYMCLIFFGKFQYKYCN